MSEPSNTILWMRRAEKAEARIAELEADAKQTQRELDELRRARTIRTMSDDDLRAVARMMAEEFMDAPVKP